MSRTPAGAIPLRLDAREACAPAPQELYLEVTNRCNLRCRTCPQFWGMDEDAADLPWERFLAITDQFPVLRRVVLHGIGEPLLNPDLGRMIRHLKARGAYVLFNTNGLLLRGRIAADLAASGLDELRVSIDSGTPASYRLVRGIDGFARILANLRRFSLLEQQLGVTSPRVSLWITGLRATIGELPRLVRAAAAAGVGEVYLQRLVHSERGLATRDQALFGRAAADESEALAEALRLARELGVAVRGSGELGAEHDGADRRGSGDAPWRGCHRPWRLMYVTANGNVLPCCIAPFTGASYGSITLGDLGRQTAASIWDGDAYRAWRMAMLDGAPPAACRGCGVEWSV